MTKKPVWTKWPTSKNIWTTGCIDNEKYNKNQLTSQITTGIQNESRHETDFAGVVINLRTNGIRTEVYTTNRNITTANRNNQKLLSVFDYDNLGNRIKWPWLTDLVPYENGENMIFNINIIYRRIIIKVHKN